MKYSSIFLLQAVIVGWIAASAYVGSTAQASEISSEPICIHHIEVNDNTVLHNEIDQIREKYEGEDLSPNLVKKITQEINQLYVENGFLTSRAKKEDMQHGVVTINVIEGALEEINIENEEDLWLRSSYIRKRIKRGGQTPLQIENLEGQLKLLFSDPVIEHLEASLRPSTNPGKTNLSVRVKEVPPLAIDLISDNYSPPGIGSIRYGVALGVPNLTGSGDQLQGSYYRSTTGGADLIDFSYQVPLNAMNGTLQLRGAKYSTMFTQSEFDGLDIAGEKDLYAIRYRQPVIRTFEDEVALFLDFTFQEGQTFIFEDIGTPFGIGPEEDGVSRTSVIKFGQEYIRRRQDRFWFMGSQLNFGTRLFNATNNDNPIPDGQFFSWRGQVSLAQKLGDDHLWVTQVELQLTPDGLLASEQYVIGGVHSVRGYRQNARIGDNGFRFSTEDRITILRDGAGRPTLQVVPFVDMGATWNVTDNPNSQLRQRFLIGAGLGLLWKPFPHLKIRLDYGYPFVDLDDRGDDIQDDGFYFSVSYQPNTLVEKLFHLLNRDPDR